MIPITVANLSETSSGYHPSIRLPTGIYILQLNHCSGIGIVFYWILAKFWPNSHYVLLEHYYSVEFPWWFDRKNLHKILYLQILKKNCEIRVKRRLLKWFERISLCEYFFHASKTFKLIWKPNAWIDSLGKRIMLMISWH